MFYLPLLPAQYETFQCTLSVRDTMPKSGPNTREWNSRLRAYAEGKFVFGRGQRPTTGTRWANLLFKIDNCPRHASTGKDLFGNPIQCTCLYHESKVCGNVKFAITLA